MATEADHNAVILFDLAGVMFGAPAQDVDTTGLMQALTMVMPSLWNVARTKVTGQGLLPLFTKLEAIDALLGQVRAKVDADLGPLNLKQSHLFRNLQYLRDKTQEEIVRKELLLAKSYRPAVGQILAKAPTDVTVPTVTITDEDGVRVAEVERIPIRHDPNDPAFSGHPLRRKPGDYDPTLLEHGQP